MRQHWLCLYVQTKHFCVHRRRYCPLEQGTSERLLFLFVFLFVFFLFLTLTQFELSKHGA
jgi:hypothetical protein